MCIIPPSRAVKKKTVRRSLDLAGNAEGTITKYWAFARGGAWRNPKPTGGSYICKQCRLDACGGNDAEVERGLISERTKEGLAAAKAKGKLLGRPNGALGKSKLDGKEAVSRNMSRIRSSDTRLEVQFGKAMWAAGIRYRKQYPVTGKPDFALPRLKIAVFCDSHFWHGYRWTEHGRKQIRTRSDFWIPKIERNMERDREVRVATRLLLKYNIRIRF